MTFRPRLIITSLVAVLLPMIILAFFIRSEMTRRISLQYDQRVASLIEVIEEDLLKESRTIAVSINALKRSLVNDNSFRNAVTCGDPEERRYLIDFAGNAIELAGF